ncbi:hypothetical protein N7519_010236 [Penicillium mononematosum]|uniref:uncharacterized protein n=1 Tax=Penicillium mononematosum TaxID=268346 RepID=UPI0025472F4A|nr:uncharacterized protein N7519_010236 [Penicillium mononematosum]KAJ6179775.1 hypothetical protein N7519_010236 [Penicillium mononematosum]
MPLKEVIDLTSDHEDSSSQGALQRDWPSDEDISFSLFSHFSLTFIYTDMEPNRDKKVEDLADEKALRIGLILLYNKITGMSELHFKRSVHIEYSQVPSILDLL